MSGIPPFYNQNGIPPFLQSSATPPPFFGGQYGRQTAPTPTPEQIQEWMNSSASNQAIPQQMPQQWSNSFVPRPEMKLKIGGKEIQKTDTIIKGCQIFVHSGNEQQIPSIVTEIEMDPKEVKAVNLVGKISDLEKFLSAARPM